MHTSLYALAKPLGWSDPSGLDVWIENTDALRSGLHQRICVDQEGGFGPYCISFGIGSDDNDGDMFQASSSCEGGCGADEGKIGNGVVYFVIGDKPIRTARRMSTTREEDREIYLMLRDELNKSGPYNLIGNNCRTFVDNKFEQIRDKIGPGNCRQTTRGRRCRR